MPQDLHTEVAHAIRDVAEHLIVDGTARLVEGKDEFGPYLRLIPRNPGACELMVYPDPPVLCLGVEGHCTDLWGSEEEDLATLRKLVEAVIAGRYEWRHRQATRRRFPGVRSRPYTQFVGTFQTEDGPWSFTHEGAEPPGAVEHRTYEPYRA